LNQNQIEFLQKQGYNVGLIKALDYLRQRFPKRCWVLDNGSSMNITDSHKIGLNADGSVSNLNVSRWEELKYCVGSQVQLTSVMNMPMRFALVNQPPSNIGPQYFAVGENGVVSMQQDIQTMGQIMTTLKPSGPTTLSQQLAGLQKFVTSIAHLARNSNHTISVVVATQGIPTNEKGESNSQVVQQFIQILKSFENLPVYVMIRLCTDDERVFDFYNSIQDQLRFPYDVLDDFFGESLEVYLQNPWLTYGLPLHKFRELGFYVQVLDAIDERPLTIEDLRNFCALLFGNSNLPDPKTQWNAFFSTIGTLLSQEPQQWNPVTRKFNPWINMVQLERLYKPTVHQPHFHQGTQQYNYNQQQPQPQQYQQPQEQQVPKQSTFVPNSNPPAPVPTPASNCTDHATIKKNLLMTWALQPPAYQSLKKLPELLATVQIAFPPAFNVEEHSYFGKWRPLSSMSLTTGVDVVTKRALRKMKFLLHPDKLPKDLTETQAFVCKTIWDIIADAAEAYNNK